MTSIRAIKVIIAVLGLGVLSVCLTLFPLLIIREVANRPGDYSLYPLLVWMYGFCLAFLIALFQTHKFLGLVETNTALTSKTLSISALVKKSLWAMIGFLVLEILTLRIVAEYSGDDPAGPTALSILGILVLVLAVLIITTLEKPVRHFLAENQSRA